MSDKRARHINQLLPSRMVNRREFVLMGAAAATSGIVLAQQGMASRGIRPQPRGKPSGRPFLAHFTDVAAAAGLTAPVIYGGVILSSR